ncbi:maleylpyruvate isomerase family mycothiol-dependent enzyme [Nocardioides sp. SYSU DS0663]|uniref:maleylpyruvate isomerase family mycothiol-dependent enzyme n=1 Tax=Nocardioides sp. SYSU DS0663 TaxID=3416445 RepID=UPI003F4B23ED
MDERRDGTGDDRERLAGYVEVWWEAVHDFTHLLEKVPDEQWSTPTDLAGWDVRAVAAHVAHLEKVLATGVEETTQEPIRLGEPAHVTSMMGCYTEIGPANRRTATPDQLIMEIREAATARHTALLADPPTDGAAHPERVFGGVPWTWEKMLRNRPLDVWMHEQDVRRAVDMPGGMDSRAAQHTADYLAESLGYVLAKRLGAAPGTSLVLELEGSAPVAFAVDDKGRGEQLAELPTDPTVALAMDRETFVVLAGGRRRAPEGAVRIRGDQVLGARVVEQMATTP